MFWKCSGTGWTNLATAAAVVSPSLVCSDCGAERTY
jgi:hypothetical protein